MDLRLMEQACGCSTVRGAGELQVHSRLCRRHIGRECLPPRPAACSLVCNRATKKLQLVEHACSCSAVRGAGGLQVHSRLCRRHIGRRCLPQRPADCSLVCNSATMKLRLVEHATAALRCEALADTRCVLVSDATSEVPADACEAVADSRCVLFCAAGTRVESHCRHDQPSAVRFTMQPP